MVTANPEIVALLMRRATGKNPGAVLLENTNGLVMGLVVRHPAWAKVIEKSDDESTTK